MTTNKIIIIGARGGSKRVENKNLRMIGKYRLLDYTLKSANSLGYPIYLSSDYRSILELGEEYGVNIIKRPKELASDTATDLDWIKHLLNTLSELPEQLIFLRPTTPFRYKPHLLDAIEKFDKTKYTSLRSVEELSESSYKTFIVKDGYLKGFSEEYQDMPNQQVPATYKSNGYIDILVTQQILEFDTLYGNSILPFMTRPVLEIDTEKDIKYANFLLEKNLMVEVMT